jgi:DNA-binding response OmpR family regulator
MVKLLIIDDDLQTCDFLKRYLEKRDYEIFIANNDKDAISITKEKKPKIVLLDIRMPGVSGITVLQKIKEFDKDIKVVMMTAVRDESMVELAKEYGASDYIIKPFTLEYLEKEVMTKILKQLV